MSFSYSERNIVLVYTTLAIFYLIISTITVVFASTSSSKIPGAQQVLNKIKNAQPRMIHVLHFG